MSTGAIPSPMAGYNDMSDTILSNGKAKKKKKDFTSYWQRSPSSNAIPLTYTPLILWVNIVRETTFGVNFNYRTQAKQICNLLVSIKSCV